MSFNVPRNSGQRTKIFWRREKNLQNDEEKTEKLTPSVTKEGAKCHGKARRYSTGPINQ
jgi:hypothetical protein